ncbi:uroporphyrinogen-III C-methyltransferase [Phycicoccus sp. 3266]|uniref:uroporphyrinogen-III C-methyltransferase n=1 Tax=Phycicoccus sp. 3266 TaxID=2817751 RepID=UPI00285C4936|nr:uroporphyrinogen-III C-methyltransferase [Phycicoccus sp. 3266]MDR6865151.1 uroporphyrin-III C-methyltransferase/precorrin-2 dehydrogenase/sirohydrochlorin ferrochelatase [Phycicoccus sp. 3266]
MTTLLGLDLRGRRVLVAGGGPVAARRAAALVADGAVVTVVAPHVCEDLRDLVVAGSVRWEPRDVAEHDVDGAWLVQAATDDPRANAELCRWAERRRVWSVNAGEAGAGSARTPATTTHAGLVVGVLSQDGSPDPARAAAVRDALATQLTCGPLDLRPRRRADGVGVGRVVLVGGGPGAEDLMTVRGRRALSEADVVVTDRLGPTGLLAALPRDVEVVDVGKTPGLHAVPQEEINRILVEQAQRGRTVVRLKGGDPFVYGRGGEEVQACRAHGIPVEVVPGVSSALSGPGLAGIPLTHRGTVGSVHVAHGHRALETTAVACVVERSATLVLLMGVSLLAEHVDQLLAAGADPGTPAAVVERASLPDQRVTTAPLGGLVRRCLEVGVAAPAVVVVGDVAAPGLLEAPA